MLTDNQDKEIFRDIFNFYQKNKNNGTDLDKWKEATAEASVLADEYNGCKLFTVLLNGVYSQFLDDCKGGDNND